MFQDPNRVKPVLEAKRQYYRDNPGTVVLANQLANRLFIVTAAIAVTWLAIDYSWGGGVGGGEGIGALDVDVVCTFGCMLSEFIIGGAVLWANVKEAREKYPPMNDGTNYFDLPVDPPDEWN